MYKSAISMVLVVSLSGLLQGCLGPAVVSAGIGATMMAEDPRTCLLYTSPSPRDVEESRMPSSA